MRITKTIEETRAARGGMTGLALVPTLGAMHEGHRALIRRARELADHVAVSIFLNPTQFGPSEDFESYPRPLTDDLAMCRGESVDLVLVPTVDEIYPADEAAVVIEVPSLGGMLEAAHRPGHFAGVCGVVAKLFGIVRPDVAVFGEKDYQQLKVIEALAAGLCLGVKIEACATVRDADGLALSSRNVNLSAGQRRDALGLSRSMAEAERLVGAGERDPVVIEGAMRGVLAAHQVAVDYAVVRDAARLGVLETVDLRAGAVVCLVAGRVGDVRLIDQKVLD